MTKKNEEKLHEVVGAILDVYNTSEIPLFTNDKCLPNKNNVIGILKDLRKIMFPGYYDEESCDKTVAEFYVGHHLTSIFARLVRELELALSYQKCNSFREQSISTQAEEIALNFFEKLPYIQTMLLKDVTAGFEGDPAAKSKEEVIFAYPGLFAIYVYRVAHELYLENVPFIPRIMTEYAHSRTGIDINAGACIGEYFFIDHGTGVVVGETTVIGDRVKLYQGVTLGALSTKSGQKLKGKKRHPTVENNVTIYSGATILGGDTVIGENSVIGGNTFVTESIPKNTKVSKNCK